MAAPRRSRLTASTLARSTGDKFVPNDNVSELTLGRQLGKGNYGVVFQGAWRGRSVPRLATAAGRVGRDSYVPSAGKSQ